MGTGRRVKELGGRRKNGRRSRVKHGESGGPGLGMELEQGSQGGESSEEEEKGSELMRLKELWQEILREVPPQAEPDSAREEREVNHEDKPSPCTWRGPRHSAGGSRAW